MKNVAVVTGGAGGMGIATAQILGKENHIVIADLNQKRLESAAFSLEQLGISCDWSLCDVTDRASVDALIEQATNIGKLASVVHTAGISPQMADAATILRVNALGTVNVTNACFEVATEGFSLINVASMAAHMLPRLVLPVRAYHLAQKNPDQFLKKSQALCRFMPNGLYRTGMAYGISKNFVIWYSKRNAARFGEKGARIVSVSPGTFDTEMGHLEEKSGSAEMLKKAALKRFGRPEEIAELLAFCASEKAGYLTGVDILCDGGVVASRQ